MQDRVRNRRDWRAGIYCKNAGPVVSGETRRKAQETEITGKRPCGEAYHQQGRGMASGLLFWAAGRRSGHLLPGCPVTRSEPGQQAYKPDRRQQGPLEVIPCQNRGRGPAARCRAP